MRRSKSIIRMPLFFLRTFKAFVGIHSECSDHIVAIVPAQVQGLLRSQLIWNRNLGKGNRTRELVRILTD